MAQWAGVVEVSNQDKVAAPHGAHLPRERWSTEARPTKASVERASSSPRGFTGKDAFVTRRSVMSTLERESL